MWLDGGRDVLGRMAPPSCASQHTHRTSENPQQLPARRPASAMARLVSSRRVDLTECRSYPCDETLFHNDEGRTQPLFAPCFERRTSWPKLAATRCGSGMGALIALHPAAKRWEQGVRRERCRLGAYGGIGIQRRCGSGVHWRRWRGVHTSSIEAELEPVASALTFLARAARSRDRQAACEIMKTSDAGVARRTI